MGQQIKIKYPEIIYKYRSWDDAFHKKMLTHNELYIPTPNELNDPFDCKINYNYGFLKDENKPIEFVENMIEKHYTKLNEKGYNILELSKKLNNQILYDLIELQKQSDLNRDKLRDKHQGVVSFSIIWFNLLMWSHYSNNHKGFCLGFKTEHLINSKKFNNGGYVKYDDNYPELNPMNDDNIMNMFSMLYHKTKDWEYEQEYRMTKLFGFNENQTEFENQKKIWFENDTISEVILGLKMTNEDKSEILSICKNKGVKVYQIKEVPYKFELSREEVS